MNSAIIQRTINTLNALTNQGIKYRLETPDGKSYGNLAAAVEKAKKRKMNTSREFGAIAKHVDSYINTMNIGDMATIPDPKLPDLSMPQLQSQICSRCCVKWGKKSYTTVLTPTGVEVLRVK